MKALLTIAVLAILFSFSPVTAYSTGVDEGDLLIPSINLITDVTSSQIEHFERDGKRYRRWTVPNKIVGWRRHNNQINLVGHSEGVFRELTKVENGDIITLFLDAPPEIQEYVVTASYPMHVQFYRDNYHELMKGDEERLMILTCHGDDHRWIILAVPEEAQ